jgi:peptidoglycan/xylan/chitin deacetylase (PgdA/CDA1 family)
VRGRVFGVLAAAVIAASAVAFGVQPARPADQAAASGARCPTDPLAPAVTPQVVFDSTPRPDGSAARYGSLQYGRGPIAPYEIAITIDDGPDAALHQRVLDILDQHCIKATFFFVGRYVDLHPEMVRASAARGHIVATHSLTHPNNLRRYSHAVEAAQIRGGFDSVRDALASSPPQDRARMAPFFRFPGLNASPWMLDYLGARRIAVFSSDFGTDDWRGISPEAIEQRAVRYANASKGGVVIMHETRPHMVEELSALITIWEKQGYRFVQVVPAADARALAARTPDPLVPSIW